MNGYHKPSYIVYQPYGPNSTQIVQATTIIGFERRIDGTLQVQGLLAKSQASNFTRPIKRPKGL